MFSARDGWGNNSMESYNHGYVRVRMWKKLSNNVVFDRSIPMGGNHSDVTNVDITTRFQTHDGLISVMVIYSTVPLYHVFDIILI